MRPIPMAEPLLSVRDLRTHFTTPEGTIRAVDGIDFDGFEGRTLGLVGESGCGKSVTALALMGLVPSPGTVAGAIRFDGRELIGQPAAAWHLSLVPALAAAGYAVATFDNRGVEPSSSPPAPYSVDVMADDALALLDHLGWHQPVRVAGHSLGGWIAETLVLDHPERVRAAALMGSANKPTAWEIAITTVERDLARLDYDLPPLFYATETLRYLPISDIQDSELVSTWLSLLGDVPVWPNPGRLGQYEAALAWSTDPARTTRWPEVHVPTLVLAFEHDVDSPPRYARQAAEAIPGCEYREVAGAGHIGILTHADEVARILVEFFDRA